MGKQALQLLDLDLGRMTPNIFNITALGRSLMNYWHISRIFLFNSAISSLDRPSFELISASKPARMSLEAAAHRVNPLAAA